MTQINLLPWREHARQQRKIRFFIILSLFVGFAILLDILIHLFMTNLINYQLRTNDYLQMQIDQEKAIVITLNKMKKEGNKIFSQLQFIYGLQNTSFKAVRLLDALAYVMPDGVLLTKIIRTGDNITLIGKAKSNLQVTLLMGNIAKSSIFNQPVLTEISGIENESGNEINFKIKVVQQE